MSSAETLREFYETRTNAVPPNLEKAIDHFNVFKFEDLVGCMVRPIPYNRREYFKIGLILGENKIHLSDQTIHIKKQALIFATPSIRYNWEYMTEQQTGYSCIFTPSFFHHFGNLHNYAIFQPHIVPILELTDEQTATVKQIYEQMLTEMGTDYAHKYDRMRNLVFELLHYASRMEPIQAAEKQQATASQRIATQFQELLEKQFPIPENGTMALRTASDFAAALSIHVNHLNKTLHETLYKSTSALILERILLEAKIMLKHSAVNVAEVAYALGFKETTHFNNFFKKHVKVSPTRFRNK